MPVYDYICRTCGKEFETDKLVSGSEWRHLKDDLPLTHPDVVCGTVTRNWKRVNVNTVNLRSARG